MSMSRRAFVQTAAVIPAVGASVGLMGTAPAAVPVETAAIAKPAYPWQWWFSYDGGDVYTENFATMDEAIEHARAVGGGLVAECQQKDFDLSVDGYEMIEMINQHNEEALGEGYGVECTSEQARDLGDMVSAAIEDWARKHKVDTTAWTFGRIRNKTVVPDTRNRV